jgi:DNA repair protein RadC
MVLGGNMGKKLAKISSGNKIEDVFIREVRVNYVSTNRKQFDIRGPSHVASFFRSVAVDNSREQFIAIYLNGAHSVISYSLISIGSAKQVQVTAPEIFQRALLVGATAMVVAHNHPSNRLEPSEQDISVTKALLKAGAILGIAFLDHVIVSDTECNSLRETQDHLFD